MKLKITGGNLDVEIVEGSMSVEDVRSMLKKLYVAEEAEAKDAVKNAGRPKHAVSSSKSNMQDKLNAKSRMPI